MHHFSNALLEKLVVHRVGNKLREEDLKLSKGPFLASDAGIKDLLLKYFLSPFKNTEYYHLHHEADLKLNEIYTFACSLFDDPDTFFLRSINIAKHLYEQSTHPKIKSGELYVAYLGDCMTDDEPVEALGIFKSESKETYLRVYPDSNNNLTISIHNLCIGVVAKVIKFSYLLLKY